MNSTRVATLPIGAILSVNGTISKKLHELGINRLFDLLMHLPRDYEDKSRIVPLNQIEHGMNCLVSGQIVRVSHTRGLSVIMSDGTGEIELKFFHTYPALLQTMVVGASVRAFGEIRVSRFGVQIAHPEYQLANTPLVQTGLVAIYPSVKGLHQNKLRQLIRHALSHAASTLVCLGREELERVGYSDDGSLIEALYRIHLPDPKATMSEQAFLLHSIKNRSHPACRRLILEELVAHQLGFMYRRANAYAHKAPQCHRHSRLANQLVQSLPFELTAAQKRVIDESTSDMATTQPMLRLVQGDVGAGKTLVAAVCACYAIDSGWQVALMAPTEILAQQHAMNFQKWFSPLGVRVGVVLGNQSAKERKNQLEAILNNEVQLVIGTHALFYDGVQFAKLGLVVIDEQHRFGVEQRLKLTDKGALGTMPHQLAMSATPIPRTLAMSMYGDMDVSIIDELPPNRSPVTTVMIDRNRRDEVLERIVVNCKQGKQAYWICPLVEESSERDIGSAQHMYEMLANELDIKVGLVHGKMKAVDKQAVMEAFKVGQVDLLIATTVVEVGVDVPNASLMIIENAERLGLSQLHQLRGRVGRGSTQSFCVLLYQSPLSTMGLERLGVLKSTTDGFVVAQKDLSLRGAGELLGKRQAGDMGYYIADIVRDESLLDQACTIAQYLIATPAKKALCDDIMALWLPDSQSYVNA